VHWRINESEALLDKTFKISDSVAALQVEGWIIMQTAPRPFWVMVMQICMRRHLERKQLRP
jgi:hypothetical protein